MIKQFYKDLQDAEGSVKAASKEFCEGIGVTIFAYARIYDDRRASWITSNADQDCFLLDSKVIYHEPTFNTKQHVKEGASLWFCDKKFPGSSAFYEERRKRFSMDHGLILSRHREGYLENCYFSGSLDKRPLYNLFANDLPLFYAFMDHFIGSLNKKLENALIDALPFSEFCTEYEQAASYAIDREKLLSLCGLSSLATLSQREKECLTLFSKGYTYEAVGKKLFLSTRTVEHYIESVKNKTGFTTRAELYKAATYL